MTLDEEDSFVPRVTNACHCPTVLNLEGLDQYVNCNKLDIFVDIYWTTAVIRLEGQWQHELHATNEEDERHLFILKTRGPVTDATIKCGEDYVRTVTIIDNNTRDIIMQV